MFIDLLYAEDEPDTYEALVREGFPDAVIERDYDEIHQYRLNIELPDEKRDEFYVFALKQKFARLLLGFELALQMKPDEVRRWMMQAGIEVPAVEQGSTPE
jgi:hypothetical protein